MTTDTDFTTMFGLRLPIIMAPMFLVSNKEMMLAAMECGIMGVFPSLNFRNENELANLIDELHHEKNERKLPGQFGVNLIVQKSNPLYEKHLKICVEHKVPFYITSLGNPSQVIESAHQYGAKVFCDVTNLEHAAKCASLKCDGFIAVGQGAGGHAGPYPLSVLVPSLQNKFPAIPVISAGGVATGDGIVSMLSLGSAGVSIGTRFIASAEATVSSAYKQAVIESGMENIVMTEKLSGTPCAIINTPYAQKIGYKQNFFERLLSHNSTTKKYFKMLVQIRGLKKLEEAVKPGNYNNLWCAGQSSELVHSIQPCKVIVDDLESGMLVTMKKLSSMIRMNQ